MSAQLFAKLGKRFRSVTAKGRGNNAAGVVSLNETLDEQAIGFIRAAHSGSVEHVLC